jgi:hypothetical protein
MALLLNGVTSNVASSATPLTGPVKILVFGNLAGAKVHLDLAGDELQWTPIANVQDNGLPDSKDWFSRPGNCVIDAEDCQLRARVTGATAATVVSVEVI